MRLPDRFAPPDLLRAPGRSPVKRVAVPGLGLSVHGWSPTLSRMTSPSAGVAMALPAFGMRAGGGTALDPGASAERAIDRLDELGLGRVALLGHSASCQVVAEVARRAPERVRALVLVGPTTDPDARAWGRLARRWVRTVRREPLWQVPLLLRDYTYSGLAGFARAIAAARHHRLDDVLADVRCPVLLVRGAHDHICPSAWLDRLAARSGHATTSTVASSAHMIPLTHPDALAAVLARFLVTGAR